MRPKSRRVFEENYQVCGARKIWRRIRLEGVDSARRTIGSSLVFGVFSEICDTRRQFRKKQLCPMDKVNRQFRAPTSNMVWVSDFTCVATQRGSLISPPSSMPVFARSSAGASAQRLMQGAFPMLWSRRSMKGVRQMDRGRFTTATRNRDICPFATVSGWRTSVSNARWAALASVTTTHWLKPSRSSLKPMSVKGVVDDGTSKPSNMPGWNGSTGSTTVACSRQSGTSSQPGQRQTSMQFRKLRPWPRN